MKNKATEAVKKVMKTTLLKSRMNGRVRLEFGKKRGFNVVMIGKNEIMWFELEKLLEVMAEFKEIAVEMGVNFTHKQQTFTRTEFAKKINVHPSTLRYWERKRILVPKRKPHNNWRVYDYDDLMKVKNEIMKG